MGPWAIANPLSIQIDNNGNVWHAGRCIDMLAIGQGRIVVASDTGGLWYIDGAYSGAPLSDEWDRPDMECLVRGPMGENHLMAGTRGALYETDPDHTDLVRTDPVFRWREVVRPDGVTTIHRIAVPADRGSVVIGTDAGIWWSPADGTGNYHWTAAVGIPRDDFTGLAVSSAGLIAGVGGPYAGAQGIYSGRWQGNGLAFTPASYGTRYRRRAPTVQPGQMRQVSVATCNANPERAYAIAADGKGRILYILFSTDGGGRWLTCGMNFTAAYTAGAEFIPFFGNISAGGRQKTISVHPDDPDVVAFSWLRAAISSNRGSTWTPLGGDWNPANGNWEYHQSAAGLHEDTHAVYFDTTYVHDRIYVLSDGGVAQSDDWREFQRPFKSAMNRELANLQFLSPATRGFWGTLGVAAYEGIIGGGLQDNGNVWCEVDLARAPRPWLKAQGGDGGWVSFLDVNPAQMLVHTSDQTDNDPTHHLLWDGVNRTFAGPADKNVIPLLDVGGGLDPRGLKGATGERVPRPAAARARGMTLYAVAEGEALAGSILKRVPVDQEGKDLRTRIVFGLYGGDPKGFLVWEILAALPSSDQVIFSMGPDGDGREIFVGDGGGRIFVVDTVLNRVEELTVEVPKQGLGPVKRIVSSGERGAYAMMDSGVGGGHILRLEATGWRVLDGGLPFEQFYGLDMNSGHGKDMVAVATDAAVWATGDRGDTWIDISGNLPRRPHCSDLRFGVLGEEPALFLSTYGRSVWVARLGDLTMSDPERIG